VQLIPHEKQFIRVLLGMLVSNMYLVLLSVVRLYKRQDVFVVACGLQSAATLTFCMALCVLQYTSLETIESEAAPRLLGFDTVDSLVVTMISINLVTLGAVVLFAVYRAFSSESVQVLRMVQTRQPPVFGLAKQLYYHLVGRRRDLHQCSCTPHAASNHCHAKRYLMLQAAC
jgi:hypothetical protein